MEKDIKTDYSRSREREDDSIDLRYIVDVIWDLKYWIVASVVAFLAAGYIYLKIATPEYTRSATLLIANDRMTGGMGSELQILSDITGMKANGLVQNEIYILKSRPLMQSVVEDRHVVTRIVRAAFFGKLIYDLQLVVMYVDFIYYADIFRSAVVALQAVYVIRLNAARFLLYAVVLACDILGIHSLPLAFRELVTIQFFQSLAQIDDEFRFRMNGSVLVPLLYEHADKLAFEFRFALI